ncbi:30S ribosomal protein S6e [Candidatus Woesearchaeota archaeon]|nr:30S ribosomal protein S6e [Candidatus Woesearchaeota archaeon]
MAEFKINIGDAKTGKTLKLEVKSPQADSLIGKKIGDTVKGELFNLPGYELLITGGTDFAGFPMVPHINTAGRKRILTGYGTGMRIKKKGFRRRKTVVGNTISESIVQINLKIVKHGRKPLWEEEKQQGEQQEQQEQEKQAKEKQSQQEKQDQAQQEAKQEA